MPHNFNNRKVKQKLEEELTKQSHFTKQEVKGLLDIYVNQYASNLKMDRVKFREIMHISFHMTTDILLDRIFRGFDRDNDGKISPEEWVKGMSIMLRGTKKEYTKYCFDVYDLNSDGWITKEEMFHLLKDCLPKVKNDEDPDEGVRDLVDYCIKQMDYDGDMRVSFDDYCKAIQNDDLLLQGLGPIIPSAHIIRRYMADLEDPYYGSKPTICHQHYSKGSHV